MRSFFGVLSWVWLLTLSTFRLNSRDYIRDRSTTDNQDNAFNLSSIRIDPMTRSDTSGFKSRQPGVSVTVDHSSTTSDFRPKKSDHDVEPTFENRKAVWYLYLVARPRLISILFAGYKHHPSSNRGSNIGIEHVGSWRSSGVDSTDRIHKGNHWTPLVTLVLQPGISGVSVLFLHCYTQVVSLVTSRPMPLSVSLRYDICSLFLILSY